MFARHRTAASSGARAAVRNLSWVTTSTCGGAWMMPPAMRGVDATTRAASRVVGASAKSGFVRSASSSASSASSASSSSMKKDDAGLLLLRRAATASAALVGFAAVGAVSSATMDAAVTSPMDAALGGQRVTLYQYDVCPFCNKVKAFLDFYKVPYDVVEVNPMTKSELGWVEDGWKKVPIVMVGDEKLNDSSAIVAELTKRFDASGSSAKAGGWFGGKKSKAYLEREEKWMKWIDDRFVHVLTPNIYRTWNEAVRSFDYITQRGNFGYFERESARWVGAASMYVIAHRVLKKRHNIVDERAELYAECDKFVEEGLAGKKFCGGDSPNNADLCVFGVLRAVKTFETFADVMENTSIKPWYDRMVDAVGEASRTDGIPN
jgi:microsomal prostaglandin-E synthase 2